MFTREQLLAWQKGECMRLMRDCGVEPGQIVIDFGCGRGNYAFGAAEAVGATGIVYALDIEPEILSWLEREKPLRGVENLIVQMSHENGEMDFDDESADAILVYDLIHMEDLRRRLLPECARVLKSGGLLSVLPFHMTEEETERVMKEVAEAGFVPDTVLKDRGLHFDLHLVNSGKEESFAALRRATIYNFRKR